MNYVPADLIRPVRLNEVAGPAIVLPEPGRDEAFLVTTGEQPYVCFINGTYVGDGFPMANAARWKGLAIEAVRFEVDQTSLFEPALIEQPLGALIRAGTDLSILIGIKDAHGFNDVTRVPVVCGLPASSADSEVGFRKWRAVAGDVSNPFVVFGFEATKTRNM